MNFIDRIYNYMIDSEMRGMNREPWPTQRQKIECMINYYPHLPATAEAFDELHKIKTSDEKQRTN
jgi:hypothetical protein